jgi:hypothetical protein
MPYDSHGDPNFPIRRTYPQTVMGVGNIKDAAPLHKLAD